MLIAQALKHHLFNIELVVYNYNYIYNYKLYKYDNGEKQGSYYRVLFLWVIFRI